MTTISVKGVECDYVYAADLAKGDTVWSPWSQYPADEWTEVQSVEIRGDFVYICLIAGCQEFSNDRVFARRKVAGTSVKADVSAGLTGDCRASNPAPDENTRIHQKMIISTIIIQDDDD